MRGVRRNDGPDGSLVVRVVDRCPECPRGDIDLSESAFAKLAEPSLGRVAIQWRYVACETSGPIAYRFKDGSNPWWTAVQIRNHRYPIVRFEYINEQGVYEEVSRVEYNFFVKEDGFGEGPYRFRVTDVNGQVIEDSEVPLLDGEQTPSESQFPICN